MGVFNATTVNILAYDIENKTGTRTPNGKYTFVATVPCRICGTHNKDIVLFILRKYVDKLPVTIKKNFKIEIPGSNLTYVVSKTPIWAGGKTHHLEIDLEVQN